MCPEKRVRVSFSIVLNLSFSGLTSRVVNIIVVFSWWSGFVD
jgi:hypothetical protein